MRRKRIIAPVILAVFFCVLWLFLTHFELIHSSILPYPATVVERLHFGISNGYLLHSLTQTTLEALAGALLAAAIGVPLGIAIAHLHLFGASVEPFIAASQAIPAVAVAPILVTWVGYGTRAIIMLCFIIVVFPIIVSTTVAIRELDRDVIDAARLDGAASIHRIWYIELPLAAPTITSGMRTGFTLAMTGAVVGEMVIGGQRGLGIELITAQHQNDLAGMFATIFLLAVVAILIYSLMKIIELRFYAKVTMNKDES